MGSAINNFTNVVVQQISGNNHQFTQHGQRKHLAKEPTGSAY